MIERQWQRGLVSEKVLAESRLNVKSADTTAEDRLSCLDGDEWRNLLDRSGIDFSRWALVRPAKSNDIYEAIYRDKIVEAFPYAMSRKRRGSLHNAPEPTDPLVPHFGALGPAVPVPTLAEESSRNLLVVAEPPTRPAASATDEYVALAGDATQGDLGSFFGQEAK